MITNLKYPVLALTFMLHTQCIFAQPDNAENQHYIYNTVSFYSDLRDTYIYVCVDDGQSIHYLKDDQGNSLQFKTPAAIMMYLESKGWEFSSNGTSTSFKIEKGEGSSSNLTYWIIRKPCTKEELETAVTNGIEPPKIKVPKKKKRKRGLFGLW